MGRKIIPRIRLTSAKDLVEVEAELGNICDRYLKTPNVFWAQHFSYPKFFQTQNICATWRLPKDTKDKGFPSERL